MDDELYQDSSLNKSLSNKSIKAASLHNLESNLITISSSVTSNRGTLRGSQQTNSGFEPNNLKTSSADLATNNTSLGMETRSIKSEVFVKEDKSSLGLLPKSSSSNHLMENDYSLSGKLKSQSNMSVNHSMRNSHSTLSKKNQLENLSIIEEDSTSLGRGYERNGYKERFPENIKIVESGHLTPKCIPPWAKTIRKQHGLSTSDELEGHPNNPSRIQMREKIEKLMKKHKELMLVKKIESKNQLGIIMEPNKSDDIEKINMKTKSTKYYITPFTKSDKEKLFEDSHEIESKVLDKPLLSKSSDNDSISLSQNKPKHQTKKELVNAIKTFKRPTLDKKGKIDIGNYKVQKDSLKCPNITLSKIREYVNSQSMDPNERELQEIIKIEKVPSGNIEDRRKLTSKYIINLPQSKYPEIASLNVVKIKEKHKLRLHSVENIDETITELHYRQAANIEKRKCEQFLENVTEKHIKKKLKSPTETKTLEVISKRTPEIVPFIDKDHETDKVLLIQYEKKSKPGKIKDDSSTIKKTQLLGINQPHREETREMYLYGTETDGNEVKESLAIVDNASPTLTERVNLIFEELREQTFKAGIKPQKDSSETENLMTKGSTAQLPQMKMETTDEATVQAMPEVKSAGIQVSQSMFLPRESVSFLKVPYPSLGSLEKETSTVKKAEKVSISNMLIEDRIQFIAQESDLSTGTKTLQQDRIQFIAQESDLLTGTKTLQQDRIQFIAQESDLSTGTKTLQQGKALEPSLLAEEKPDVLEEIVNISDSAEVSLKNVIEEEGFIEREEAEKVIFDEKLKKQIPTKISEIRQIEKELPGEELVEAIHDSKTSTETVLSIASKLPIPKFEVIPSSTFSNNEEFHSNIEVEHSKSDEIFSKTDVVSSSKSELPPSRSDVTYSKEDVEPSNIEVASSKMVAALQKSDMDKENILISLSHNLTAPTFEVIPSRTTLPNNKESHLNIEVEHPETELPPSKSDVTYSKTDVEPYNIDLASSQMEVAQQNDMDKEKIPISHNSHIISAEDEKNNLEHMGKSYESFGNVDSKQTTEMNGMSEVEALQFDESATDRYFRKAGYEDIRSYDLPLQQDHETKLTFLTKFACGKKSLRKKMDWTDNAIYLENKTCPQLVCALAETAVRQPADPISFLAHRIYKDFHNQEREDNMEVWKEHLELARTMKDLDIQGMKNKGWEKFNLKKYPIKEVLAENRRINEDNDMDLLHNGISGNVN